MEQQNSLYVGNEQCVLEKNVRPGTLEDEYPYSNFEVDENLNFIRMLPEDQLRAIKEEE